MIPYATLIPGYEDGWLGKQALHAEDPIYMQHYELGRKHRANNETRCAVWGCDACGQHYQANRIILCDEHASAFNQLQNKHEAEISLFLMGRCPVCTGTPKEPKLVIRKLDLQAGAKMLMGADICHHPIHYTNVGINPALREIPAEPSIKEINAKMMARRSTRYPECEPEDTYIDG